MKRLKIIVIVAACILFAATMAYATAETTGEAAGTHEAVVAGQEAATEGHAAATGEHVAATGEHEAAAGGHAAAAEGHEAGGHGGPNYTDFILRLVNFALFLGLIWYLAGKKIKAFFGGRQVQIKNELDDLDARRKNAEAKLRQVEKSIANIEQERQAILDEFASQGEALKKTIVADAEKKAERILAQAGIAIATERNVALGELRSEMADLIVEAAEKILREKLTKEEHDKLVEDYLTKVVLN